VQKELDTAVGQIRHAFEQLNSKSAGANVDLENMAVQIEMIGVSTVALNGPFDLTWSPFKSSHQKIERNVT
jgi:hypothetical protein